MGSFNVLVNGALRTTTPDLFADGTAGAPGIAFTNDPTMGFYRQQANVLGVAIGGGIRFAFDASGANNQVNILNNAIAWGSGSVFGNSADTFLLRDAAKKLKVTDGGAGVSSATLLVGTLGDSSNVLTVASTRMSLSVAGALDFPGAASTFASVATITNGPRAANPVNWVKVKFNAGASSGRVPIW